MSFIKEETFKTFSELRRFYGMIIVLSCCIFWFIFEFDELLASSMPQVLSYDSLHPPDILAVTAAGIAVYVISLVMFVFCQGSMPQMH